MTIGNQPLERYQAALKLVEQGRISDAISALQVVVADNPTFSIARNDLGALLFESGQAQNAKSELMIAYNQQPNDPVITENYLEALLATDSIEEVFPQLEKMVRAVGTNSLLIGRVSEVVTKKMETARLREWDRTIEGVTQKVVNQILPFLSDGATLIDVGANCGLFTEQVLRQRDVQAFLFEPVPKYFNYCVDKFQGKRKIVVENLALAEAPGNLQIFIDNENLGWNTLVQTKCTPGMQPVDIKAETFDTYADRHGIFKIDVIKIDVEGSEYRVLKGMQGTLQRLAKKPVIICEVAWGPGSHPNWNEEVEAFEWLFRNGYQRIDYNVSGTSDVIFLPL
jgi:FkbM family methyltransferase